MTFSMESISAAVSSRMLLYHSDTVQAASKAERKPRPAPLPVGQNYEIKLSLVELQQLSIYIVYRLEKGITAEEHECVLGRCGATSHVLAAAIQVDFLCT